MDATISLVSLEVDNTSSLKEHQRASLLSSPKWLEQVLI